MILLQSAQTGRSVKVLENYFIQIFQLNNMTVNEQKRSKSKSHKPLETPHTHIHTHTHTSHSLPLTKATDQSQTFQLIAHIPTVPEKGNHGENCFTPNCLSLYIMIILPLYQWYI
jgi:hypothetical protein